MQVANTAHGSVDEVLVGASDPSLVTSPRESIQLDFDGIRGDRHSGFTRLANGRDPQYPRGTLIRNERQVTVVSREELAEIATRLGTSEVQASWIGANLLVSGIPDLTALPPNTRLVFPQQAVLVVQGENRPCRWAGAVVAEHTGDPSATTAFPKAALHLRGVIACVERPGYISRGDGVEVRVPRSGVRAGP